MKYYLHSVDTMDDEKVAELFRKYGYEGTGLFHAILEKLAKQEKPVKTDILKFQLKVGKKLNKIWLFMEEIELICSTNGETFNNNLLNFSENYKIKKEKTRKKVSEWREKQRDTKNVTDYVPVSNPPKVKESKVKESKVNKNIKKKDFIIVYPEHFSESRIKSFEKWFEYKKTIKSQYKSQISVDALFKSQSKLSDSELDDAVNFSIGCQYKGIFQDNSKKSIIKNNGKKHDNPTDNAFQAIVDDIGLDGAKELFETPWYLRKKNE